MMGYVCMKAVYEHAPYLHDGEKLLFSVPGIQVHHPQESQLASLKKKNW